MTLGRTALWLILALNASPAAWTEPHLLGLSAPLSGGGAGWGNDVKNVLLFANEKLASGRYSFVFEDDRCDPKTSLSIARKLTAVDHIKEVFVVCGQTTMATAAAYRRAGVTVMAPLATPSRISELGVFRTGLNDSLAAAKLAAYVAARHKSISVLTEENDYPISFFQDFAKAAKNLPLSVHNQNYLPQQQDFRPQLLRFKADDVQALFLNTQTEEALAALVKQLKEIDYAPTLYGAYLPGSAGFLKIGGKMAEGLVFVDFPGAGELLTGEGQKLYEEFTAKYGPLHGWTFAFPATFEAFRVVHQGIMSGEPLDRFLKEREFNGVFGPYRFDAHGDLVGPQHVLRIIRDGKGENLAG